MGSSRRHGAELASTIRSFSQPGTDPVLRAGLPPSLAERESVVRKNDRNDNGDPAEPHGHAPACYRCTPIEYNPRQMEDRDDGEDHRRSEEVIFLLHDATFSI